ncbi:hypothetical protein M011DRAFT_493892 [Sporormia fimetaria CBS 119925]|uniref:Adipose-regulatory protein-domain-containing protein n=1 Tax=Sporormia fimetaria CBS 119925 TaxID=1340428 RepID=A0A6A6VDY4_9PLEO|nr:hypothetical protein M011DRAFT_493892 [Sporormia fimetaria CBS 119925]
MSTTSSYEDDPETTFELLKSAALTPIHILLSPRLLRTYLRTIILLITSFILFFVAVVAYLTFYNTYIPVRGIAVPVYLDYDINPIHENSVKDLPGAGVLPSLSAPNFPTGIADVRGLIAKQKYDVTVQITMPRSERNVRSGNWMVGLEMLRSSQAGTMGWGLQDGKQEQQGEPNTLVQARRPALLTYRSPVTDLAYRILRLPLYVLGWRRECETMEIRMLEGVQFDKGTSRIAGALKLEIRSKEPLDVYTVSVRLDADLHGLRWFMYRHWVVSAVVFVGAFWAVEMTLVIGTWAALSMLFASGESDVKQEEQDEGYASDDTPKQDSDSPSLSDTSRTFPGLGTRDPIRFSSSNRSRGKDAKIKDEPIAPDLVDIPPRASADADVEDEDEDADFVLDEPGSSSSRLHGLTDSGIGTSMEEAWERGLVRRRDGRGRGRPK